MSAPAGGGAAERVYALLLRAYPAAFRAAYGREMTLLFRDLRRAPDARGARFWTAVVWDVVRSAPALRLDAWHARRQGNVRLEERTMKPMAITAVLISALELVNALAEASAGGVTGGARFVAIAMGVVAGALLAAAGAALLRRTPGAAGWAQGAAAACLGLVVLTRLVQPWMSMFATILGVAFPIVLVLFLRGPRGRGPAVPTVA